eukprot:TRINITY_DN7200_c0_g1_i1.p1 TRINITY_DN7200_c0_g1~~TRINITY_DN7200_c0_g1_i1.p1  ORF type:complete len:178 (+),score=20.92 TRINITY_DN7200_c0_g1_i1:142-675(+)
MGSLWSAFGSTPVQPIHIVMMGLDGAGKTSILYRIKMGRLIPAIPTAGFNVETVQLGSHMLQIWDVSLQGKSRSFLNNYTQFAQGWVFVVDGANVERYAEAAEYLRDTSRGLADHVPMLILLTKSDLGEPDMKAFNRGFRDLISKRKARVVRTSATTDIASAIAGLEWIVEFRRQYE